MEIAVKCSKKRCKEVFHIHENREIGGCNDNGYIVVKCKKCGTPTKIRILNPPKSGYYDNFEIIASWVDGDSNNPYECVTEGETAFVAGNEPVEGITARFLPNPSYPLWQNGDVNLEQTAYDRFEGVTEQINKKLNCLENLYLKSIPGFDDVKRCIVTQKYEHDNVEHKATWAKELKYENTMNSDLFHLINHSRNDKYIDGVYSRDEMMAYLYRCLMRWKLVANQVVVVTPFIGFDFPFSTEEVKKELISLWDLLNSILDIERTKFITRVATYGSLKKCQKEFEVPADVLKEWDLMNNLQEMVDNPKTRIKTKAQFHAKFYAGIFNDHVELLSGSFNVQTGSVLEQMHLRNISRKLFKENYLDRLVDGFEFDDSFNPRTMFIDIDKEGNANCRISGLND